MQRARVSAGMVVGAQDRKGVISRYLLGWILQVKEFYTNKSIDSIIIEGLYVFVD
jgi:hypothetical protein